MENNYSPFLKLGGGKTISKFVTSSQRKLLLELSNVPPVRVRAGQNTPKHFLFSDKMFASV